MSHNFTNIIRLIQNNDIRISDHGYDELANDKLTVREIVSGASNAVLVEDYPNYNKGASVLVLQKDNQGLPVHVVWGIPKGFKNPCVLITAYRPDILKWDKTFKVRKR